MNDLMSLYEEMKKVLENAGGYEALDDEQRDLFNKAVDKLMGAKFEHVGMEETETAVRAFLDKMAPETELTEEEPDIHDELQGRYTSSLHTASILIRAADALDKAGLRDLSNEIDALLGRIAKRK